MTLDYRFTALESASTISAADVRQSIHDRRSKSRQCSDLADSCITDDGKQALLAMAADYDAEVAELMKTLAALEQLCERVLES